MALGIGANKRLGTYSIRRPHLRTTAIFYNNYSLGMDGTDDYVDLTANVINLGTENTISMWAKFLRAAPGLMQHQLCGNKTYGGGGYIMYLNPTTLYARVGDTTANWTGSEITAAMGELVLHKWAHIMLVRTGTSTFKLYVNGAHIPGSDPGSVETLSAGVHGDTLFSLIGCGWYLGGAYNEWIGNIDEVALFSDIKELADAQSFYNLGEGKDLSEESDLEAYYRFEEGTGSTINDTTVNANHGVLFNSTWDATFPDPAYENVNSLEFDGTDDYVDIAGGAVNLSTTSTISMWCKWTGGGTIARHPLGSSAAGYASGGGYHFYPVKDGSGGRMIVRVSSLSMTWNDVTTAAHMVDFLAGEWQHWAIVRDDDDVILYINGVAMGVAKTLSSSQPDTTVDKIGTGWSAGDTYNEWIGNIDEIGLFNAVLAPSAIAALYNSGVPPDLTASPPKNIYFAEALLVAYWRLEEGTGLSTADSSLNSNTGTLENGTAWDADVPS